MSLAGKGAVAIWHDIADEGRAQFYAWHGREHMPERVGIPGFLRGRRYVALEGTPEFFNLYETASTGTVSGADYLERLNNPTPWTVDSVRHFRAVSRSLCGVEASVGAGQGGLIATFRYDVDAAAAATHRKFMTERALPAMAELPGVAGAHLLVADEAASAVETAEKKARSEGTAIPRWILLVEGWGDAAPFQASCRNIAAGTAFAGVASAPVVNVYRLQNALAST